ncbi:MAG: hypothetical protein HYY48_10155 [Gammaproteobacteria bacterium]|nr:hypothetical protein [Gammaproteobacteria bacterium]
MQRQATLSGIALATMAAGLFAMNIAANAGEEKSAGSEMVHCMGVNACKGHSSCKGADNACAGQNSCKGKGYVEMSKKACEQIGGKAEGA